MCSFRAIGLLNTFVLIHGMMLPPMETVIEETDPDTEPQSESWRPEEEQYVNTHAHDMHGMIESDQFRAIGGVQNFIQRAPEGFATLVLMGDSTMSGIVTELLNITDDIQRSLELVYVSNDRQKAIMEWKDSYDGAMNNNPTGGVKPGGDWWDATKLDNGTVSTTISRARASTYELHSSSCKSGGGLETYVFRSGPYKGLVVHHWGFLPEYAEFCWKPCMVKALFALKPTAVVWNVGFHLLNHDFKPSICNRRHNPAKPGCGNHKEMVKTATLQMLEIGIETVVWKHTNWVCEERQKSGFPQTTEALLKWGEASQRSVLESKCKQDCPQYSGMNCYDWFFNSNTAQRMYVESSDALAELRQTYGGERVRELDTFHPTRDCCDRGCINETDDGEHYAGLDSELTLQLTSILRGGTESHHFNYTLPTSS